MCDREVDPTKYFEFLHGRTGASDSDVIALEEEFNLNSDEAADIYCDWLDILQEG